jgi:hypothetical protein
LIKFENKHPEATWIWPPPLVYRADGQRTLQRISDRIELGTEMLVTFCRLREHLGLVEL